MTSWGFAFSFLLAAILAVCGLARGRDPRVGRRLRPASRFHESQSLGRPEQAGGPGDAVDLVEVVALMVGAGLSPRLAVERAAVAVPGSGSAELRRVLPAARLGTPWRETIRVAGVADASEELVSLTRILDRGQRLGVPVADALRSLAAQVRERRRVRLEERARRAPVLMLFPLVLCILPAFVVAAIVPAILVAARGFA